MKKAIVPWFRQVWPWTQRRRAVLSEYAQLGNLKLCLTDIALRGNIFSSTHVSGKPDDSAYHAGRRDLALEIIELAKANPENLFALIETKTGEKK